MSDVILSKSCTKCGVKKQLFDFYKSAATNDGLQYICKICSKAARKAWKEANPEKARASSLAWRLANPGKAEAWGIANPDKSRAIHAKWRSENAEKFRSSVAKWKSENPDKIRAYNNNRRARKLDLGGVLSTGLVKKLFKLQKGKCPCCKQPLGDDYHLDHIMPLALGGANTDDNMQLLRAVCNMQKSSKPSIEFMQQRGFLL